MSGAAAAEGSPERCVHGRMDKGEQDLPGRGRIVPLRLCGSQRVGGDPSLTRGMTCAGCEGGPGRGWQPEGKVMGMRNE